MVKKKVKSGKAHHVYHKLPMGLEVLIIVVAVFVLFGGLKYLGGGTIGQAFMGAVDGPPDDYLIDPYVDPSVDPFLMDPTDFPPPPDPADMGGEVEDAPEAPASAPTDDECSAQDKEWVTCSIIEGGDKVNCYDGTADGKIVDIMSCRSIYRNRQGWNCLFGPYNPFTGSCPGGGTPTSWTEVTGASCCINVEEEDSVSTCHDSCNQWTPHESQCANSRNELSQEYLWVQSTDETTCGNLGCFCGRATDLVTCHDSCNQWTPHESQCANSINELDTVGYTWVQSTDETTCGNLGCFCGTQVPP